MPAYYHPRHAEELPPHVKIQRAKVIVDNEVRGLGGLLP